MSKNQKPHLLERLEPRLQFSGVAHTTGNLPSPRRGGVGAVAGSRIVIAGGESTYADPSTTADVYDIATATWSTVPLPHPGTFKSAAATGGKAYFTEGTEPSGVEGRHVDIYVGAPRNWVADRLSAPRAPSPAAAVGKVVIFVGGRSVGAARSADIFDVASGRRTVAKIPIKITRGSGATVGEAAYFTTDVHGVLDKYDAATGRWSTLAVPGDTTGQAPAMVAVGTKLLIADAGQDTAAVAVYDTVTGVWSSATLPQGLLVPATAVVGAKVIFAGGEVPGAPLFSNAIEIFDSTTGTWSTDTLAVARDLIATAASGPTAVFAGGRVNTLGATDAVDIFTDTTPTPVLSGGLTGPIGQRDRVTVINTGDADLPAGYTIQLYASPDRTLRGATLVGSLAVPAPLAAGASAPFKVRTVIPAGTPAGTYHLLAAVQDAAGHITPIAAEDATFRLRGARAAVARPSVFSVRRIEPGAADPTDGARVRAQLVAR